MLVERISAIEETARGVVLGIDTKKGNYLRLRCVFQPLLDWRQRLSDEEIISVLGKYEIDVTIKNGTVIEIQVKRRKVSTTDRHDSFQPEAQNFSNPQAKHSFEQMATREIIHLHKLSQARKQQIKEERNQQRANSQSGVGGHHQNTSGMPGGIHW